MNKHYLTLGLIAGLLFSAPAYAQKALSAPPPGCSMNENATISINFSGSDKDVAAVKNKLNEKIEEVNTSAKEQHFEKFVLQSSNYSINANSGGEGDSQFQYSGSASFTVLPAEKALDFMVVLTKKGYHASANVSGYRNGNCSQATD